jgi:hypothetical protein
MALLTHRRGNSDAPRHYRRQNLQEKSVNSSGPSIARRRVGKRESFMIVASGLAIFVVVCLLLSMVQSPPYIGR